MNTATRWRRGAPPIAHKLTQVSRDTDTAARLGGEEFALLLAESMTRKRIGARRLLRIFLRSNRGSAARHREHRTAACPAHADSERALYAASDAALYVAKNEGRNRVSVAPLQQEACRSVERGE